MFSNEIGPEDLPFEIAEDRFGEQIRAALECPGVYYVAAASGEYYIVLKDTTGCPISDHVLNYGEACDDAVYFKIGTDHSGASIVAYEIKQYWERQGKHCPDEDSTLSASLFSAEEYPEYFGSLIPPRYTPRGQTTKYLKLDEGVFYLETEYGVDFLAVAYPIWDAEISPILQGKGQQWEYDRERGIDNTLGYLFFDDNCMAAVFWDLLQVYRHQCLTKYIRSENALFASIWNHLPEYALQINLQEQAGMGPGNMLYRLLQVLDIDIPELEAEPQDFIPLVLGDQDDNFLKLPDSWKR